MHVVLHGRGRDPKAPRNLLVGKAAGDQSGHLALARRQPGKHGRRTALDLEDDHRLPEILRSGEVDHQPARQIKRRRQIDELFANQSAVLLGTCCRD